MRNFTLLAGLAFLFLFSSTSFAQDKKFKGVPGLDFRIGYGITPVQNLNSSFSTELIPDLVDDKYVTLEKEGSGMFSASATFNTAGRWGFGIDAVYGKTKAIFRYPNTSTQEPESKWFTLMARVNYTYYTDLVNAPNIQLYGSIAAGSSFRDAQVENAGVTKTFNQNYLAYQITPFGIRTGQKLGFWAEIGYGFKGLLNAGLSLKF